MALIPFFQHTVGLPFGWYFASTGPSPMLKRVTRMPNARAMR